MLETKRFSPPKQRAFDARFEAQKIAFGPVVFHCVRYAWKRGMLQALGEAGERGVTLDELEASGRWSRYALKLVLESCLSAGVVLIEGGRWQLDKTGFCLISDDITRVNYDFIHDVCYQGLFELERLVRETRSAAREFRDLSRSLRENPSQILYEPPPSGVEIQK